MAGDAPRVHVVGAGLSGLSAAVRLTAAGRPVTLYDQARWAGGRCRSFHDAQLDRTIDNGNHLLLSGNTDAMEFLRLVGAEDTLIGAEAPIFPFVDVRDGRRWTVRLSRGWFPWWIFRPGDRVPGTRPSDYLVTAWQLFTAGPNDTVAGRMDAHSPLVALFWKPLAIAALNTEIEHAALTLLKPVMRETFGRGGGACRPLMAREGLSGSFIDPAVRWLAARGVELRLGHGLRAIEATDGRVRRLRFREAAVELGTDDVAVVALPHTVAGKLLPGTSAPEHSRAIVNAHYRLPPELAARVRLPEGSPLLGVFGGTAEWIFLRDDVASVTVSAADGLAGLPNDAIAERIWPDVRRALQLPDGLQPEAIRIVNEKRATFAQTPEEVARRPATRTDLANLLLAGDWTDTGLPATIEGSIRSGRLAAEAILGSAR